MPDPTDPSSVSPALRELIAAYLDDTITPAQLTELEAALRADRNARVYFAAFARHDRALRMEIHVRGQAEQVLARIGFDEATADAGDRVLKDLVDRTRPARAPVTWWMGLAAAVVIAAGLGWMAALKYSAGRATAPVATKAAPPATQPAVTADIAWLVNAQNCQWSRSAALNDTHPGDMRPGTLLDLERGLAEVRFRSGAVVLLEGPARLELVSDNSARLHRGRVTGSVQGPIKGFELFTPGGKVIDLGTSFGVAVNDAGQAEVFVFDGSVQAVASKSPDVITLAGEQSLRMEADGGVVRGTSGDPTSFVRRIVPPPVIEPRSLYLNFAKAYAGTITDAQGLGTGLTHRLPGTGAALPEADPNLLVSSEEGRLDLTTTNSDINNQRGLPTGEYLGVRLADLGFTGVEDFEVEMVVPNIPALQRVGQFGLYAGGRSDKVIRGGLISRGDDRSYTLFMTNNDGGRDRDSHFVGLFTMGDDVRIRLKRTAGKYALTVENLATGSESALAIRHPVYLDAENDLYVGLFGANTGGGARRTLQVKEFAVTVWTTAGERRSQAVALGDH